MHVTRAAEKLRLAQPALTQQIKALEEELQVELLRRVGRRIELTAAGVAFKREAQAILEHVRMAALVAQQTARGVAGRLAIGLTESAAFAPAITHLLKQARERWPAVDIHFVQARTDELARALIERRIDVAFVRPPLPAERGLRMQPFAAEPMVVALPDTHRLAARTSFEPAELGGEPFILPHGRRGEGTLRDAVARLFERHEQTLNVVQEVPEFSMAINFVAVGVGLSLVPASLAGMRTDAVVYRPLRATPPLEARIALLARDEAASPVAANFCELAGSLCGGA